MQVDTSGLENKQKIKKTDEPIFSTKIIHPPLYQNVICYTSQMTPKMANGRHPNSTKPLPYSTFAHMS